MNTLSSNAGSHLAGPEMHRFQADPAYPPITFQRSAAPSPYPIPHQHPNHHSQSQPHYRFQSDLQTPDLLDDALGTLSIKPPLCPRCRGKTYNFTAYFHNKALFKTPPHHILHLIEKSYVLKNHLQSLLVTFVLHHFELEYLHDVKKMVKAWSDNVDAFVDEVVNSAHGFQVELGPLGDVKAWSKKIGMQMWDHICGVKQMLMPAGRWSALVSEFRKLWEKVWFGYLHDQEVTRYSHGIGEILSLGSGFEI